MAGIQDVQPKQISSLGQPLVGTVEPAATVGAVEKLSDAFRQGFITADDISQRLQNAPVQAVQRKLALQQAQELLSPEAIQSRAEQTRLSSEKAQAERETLLSKDFVSAYLRYNLPLKKTDGTPDYSGMAEVGQKYADMERALKYAEMGLTGKPVQSLDERGRTITRFINSFGEDITEVPGKTNRATQEYQNMMRKARAFLLQNDKEPEVRKGAEPPKIEVSPTAITPTPTPVAAEPPPPAPIVEPIAPGEARAWLVNSRALTTDAALKLNDQEAADIYTSFQEKLARGPVVEPAAPPPPKPVIEFPVASPTVTPPAYGGEGLVTGKGTFDPDKYVSDIRTSGLYKNWEEKSPIITDFRATAKSYDKLAPNAITTQNDIALATQALLLAAPGASAGGRGMEGLRLTRLEDSQPLFERLYGLKGLLLREHKFTKETRNRIIQAAERKAEAVESQGRSAVQSAQTRLRKEGYDPEEYLFGEEKKLTSGVGAAGAGVATGGRTVTLKSGRTVTLFQ